jgi:hypothetical protein
MSNEPGINAVTRSVPARHADQRLAAHKDVVQRGQDEVFASANKDKPTAGADMNLSIHRASR